MFFHDILLGLLMGIMLVVPVTAAMAFGSQNLERTLLSAIAVIVVYAVIWTAIIWWGQAPIGFSKVAIYHEFWILWLFLLVAVVVVGYFSSDELESITPGSWVVVLLLAVMTIYGIAEQGVWNNGRAKELVHELSVTVEKKPGTFPQTDPEHILQVPEQTADFAANQVLESGASGSVGTLYELGSGVVQSVNNHLYWIFGLQPHGWVNSEKIKGGVPGYVVVDGEDPSADAQLRLGYHMMHYIGGFHGASLGRYLYANGYSGSLIGDPTLEVNNKWEPFYTASLEKVSVGFQSEVPAKALVINPQTGTIQQYPLGKEPEWVDRIYSESTVETMLNWWGKWAHAPYKFKWDEGSAGRYQVDPKGKPTLVYTRGGHPEWQAIMTSHNRDTSAAYLALFDGRDNKVRMFRIPDLTLSSTAAGTIAAAANTRRMNVEPVHLNLYKIYGQLTWVAPLIKPQGGESSSDSENKVTTNASLQGFALLRADELSAKNVVLASSMAEALTQYRQVIAATSNSSNPEENANTTTAAGSVATLSTVVEEGQTVFYFTLKGDTTHVYRDQVSKNSKGGTDVELPFIKVGTKVSLTYLNTAATLRDVSTYQDLSLHIEGH